MSQGPFKAVRNIPFVAMYLASPHQGAQSKSKKTGPFRVAPRHEGPWVVRIPATQEAPPVGSERLDPLPGRR
jgi:hypothetical protein